MTVDRDQVTVSRDPRERFSERVADYVRCRPGYPLELFDLLVREAGLGPGKIVADVGSGTGIFTRSLLESGCRVFAVEPNAPMRAAAEAALGGHPRFQSVAGSAERTSLPDSSVDLVAAAQAFHWFEPAATGREFRRILRPGGPAVLVWNVRRTTGAAFLEEYEALVARFGTDYREVKHTGAEKDAAMHAFFGPAGCRRVAFENAQVLDFEGLKGRLHSSSYVPGEGHPSRTLMLEELGRLFERRQVGGIVRLEYDTRVYFGPLSG